MLPVPPSFTQFLSIPQRVLLWPSPSNHLWGPEFPSSCVPHPERHPAGAWLVTEPFRGPAGPVFLSRSPSTDDPREWPSAAALRSSRPGRDGHSRSPARTCTTLTQGLELLKPFLEAGGDLHGHCFEEQHRMHHRCALTQWGNANQTFQMKETILHLMAVLCKPQIAVC